MGRSKPRTNKRPPPKLRQPQTTTPPPAASLEAQPTNLPYLDTSQPLDLSTFVPPPSTVDPNDPAFSAALRNWSAAALANTSSNGNPSLPIDLPASLAALFEAKLTLDREKQKLIRMQKELKGYREGVAAVSGIAAPTGTGKGKEVAVEEDVGECTCERNGHHHSYPASANSAEVYDDDEYYESEFECYNCDCSCHHIECDHEEGCECEHELDEDDEEDEPQHLDNHHDAYGEDEHSHSCGHHQNPHQTHHHQHHHHHAGEAEAEVQQPIMVPNPYLTHPQRPPPLHQRTQMQTPLQTQMQEQPQSDVSTMTYAQAFEAYQDQRDSAARGLDEISGIFKAAGWPGYPAARGNAISPLPQPRVQPDPGVPRKRLVDDPERLEEAVRELFNWIKAVVWTIEQAAVVAGRRSWAAHETK